MSAGHSIGQSLFIKFCYPCATYVLVQYASHNYSAFLIHVVVYPLLFSNVCLKNVLHHNI